MDEVQKWGGRGGLFRFFPQPLLLLSHSPLPAPVLLLTKALGKRNIVKKAFKITIAIIITITFISSRSVIGGGGGGWYSRMCIKSRGGLGGDRANDEEIPFEVVGGWRCPAPPSWGQALLCQYKYYSTASAIS